MTRLLFREDPYRREAEATVLEAREGAVVLDQTLFYPLGGGQPGDTGRIGEARVADTRRDEASGVVLHVLEPGQAAPAAGATVAIAIDWPRRHRHMRFHTALHLLGAVVKAPVTGGRIAEDKAHLDFDIEMDKLDKAAIEAAVNALAAAGHEVRHTCEGDTWTLDIVGVDRQPCGGTHVRNTAEIGVLAVARIRSEGKRNKRVTLAFA